MARAAPISFDLGLPETPDILNAELNQEFFKIYNAVRAVAYALDEYTGAITRPANEWAELLTNPSIVLGNVRGNRFYSVADEVLVLGNAVNIKSDSHIELADATSATKKCRGFALNDAGIGDPVEIILPVCNLGFFIGLTPGATYYLSDTAGVLGAGPGTNSQKVGFALTDKCLIFLPEL